MPRSIAGLKGSKSKLVCYDLEGCGVVSAQYTIKDGGPSKKEFPKNLLSHGEEDWNKWYQA